jgi:type I restriction enzyme S subunit
MENNTQTNTKLTPKLRFKEFEGDWRYSKIEDFFVFKNGLNKEKEYFGRGTPIINFMDVYKLTNIHKDDIHGLVELTEKEIERFDTQKGDVFFTRTSETINDIGMSATLIEDIPNAVFSGFVLRARPLDNSFVPNFCSYLFNINPVRKEITTKSSMTTRALTSGTLLNKVYFNFPTDKIEQQKIATFLTAVDTKIQQLTTKKQLLENYKKGVMQQLFSQQLRFKNDDGLDFPDWEEKKLGEVCIKIQDGNYGASYPKANEFVEIGIPFLTSKALGTGGSIISNKIDFIPIQKHQELKKAHLKLNDVLFTNRGANVGAIAYVDDTIAHGNIGPQLTLMRVNQEIIDSTFLLHSMNSFKVRKQVRSQDSGSAMNFFGIGATSKFKISLPSLKEQQKIANYLSAIDKKIVNVQTQIAKTQAFKKGLLQQMFV